MNTMPVEFPAYASRAIALITNSNGQLEDEEVVTLFCANSIPRVEAIELLLFLPDAFCRYMLPQINWPTYYIEYVSEQNRPEIQYADNPRFLAIQEALNSYLAGDFKQADFLKIAGRSASFKALDRMLQNGGKLENADVGPEVILR